MKNLLIATTALVATAGVAAADVSLSGAANFGVINNGDAGAAACSSLPPPPCTRGRGSFRYVVVHADVIIT